MPKENFYYTGQVEGDGRDPDLVVSWGVTDVPQVLFNGVPVDRSGINRLIVTLRRARNQVYGADE